MAGKYTILGNHPIAKYVNLYPKNIKDYTSNIVELLKMDYEIVVEDRETKKVLFSIKDGEFK